MNWFDSDSQKNQILSLHYMKIQSAQIYNAVGRWLWDGYVDVMDLFVFFGCLKEGLLGLA